MKEVIPSTASDPRLWQQEYVHQGIPSSARSKPSNVVVDFLRASRHWLPQGATFLDIGCGTGRNAVYLAEQGFSVKAMDYCIPQIDALKAFVHSRPDLVIEPVGADVTSPWPWPDHCADAAIDTFCFKHQIGVASIGTYIHELRRCLAPGGLFLLFLATRSDSYYRQFAAEQQDGLGEIIIDPGNGIASRLYDRDEVERLFEGFQFVHFEEKASTNVMHGTEYNRRSAIWHLRRAE
jgi:SAM-dependent methyltransferase